MPMINTRENERFVVISVFGSSRLLPLYVSLPPPPPVHMSSPRQQSARLARQPASQLSTMPPPPLYRASVRGVVVYSAMQERSPHSSNNIIQSPRH